MNNPYYSIIIPIYNTPIHLFEVCMDSILNQTFSDFEVILSDDGSKQECADVCDRYALQDNRVIVLHNQNQGVSAARNHGIEHAKGEHIMFIDADDWIELDTCERLSKWLDENPCDILLFNAIKEYSGKQQPLNYGFQHAHMYRTDDVAVREMLYRRVVGAPNTKQGKFCTIYYSCDKVFRRDFLLKNELRYPVGLPKSEDKVFVSSCFEKMHSLFYIDDVFYHYRIVESSACNRYSERADKDRMVMASKLKVISDRMDKELGRLKGEADYCEINDEYNRFLFGIVSDVLFLKYYHPDYKGYRRKDALHFLSQEPFRSAIKNVSYKDLTRDAKLKKLLLSTGFVGLFCFLKKKTQNFNVQVNEG